MACVPDTGDYVQIVISGAVVLVGLGSSIAWIPATRYDPGGLPARLFITAGVVAAVADPGGLGTVLGIALTALGIFVWWESQPAPEIPRPRLRGLVVAALVTATAVLGTLIGWGPFDRLPESLRLVVALGIAGAGTIGTLAVADRTRVVLRDAIRRRQEMYPIP
jgi:hypothetical protein